MVVEQHYRGGKFLKRQQMESGFLESLVTRMEPDELWGMKFSREFAGANVVHMEPLGKRLLIAISYPWLSKDPTRRRAKSTHAQNPRTHSAGSEVVQTRVPSRRPRLRATITCDPRCARLRRTTPTGSN